MLMWVMSIIFMILGVLLVIWMCRVIYMAYIKEKDDNAKQIVVTSMAHSFNALFVLFIINSIVSVFGLFESFMYALRSTIYIHPIILCIIILGIALFVNKKRAKFK